jgi:polar amino acid transport system substrate-binding protein
MAYFDMLARKNVTKRALVIGSAFIGITVMLASAAQAETTLEKIKRTGVMTIGTSSAYAPFEYIADGKRVGYDIDLATEIGKRMGVKLDWKEIDFKGIVAALKSKRVDVLFTGLTKTKQRAEQIGFSDPYYDAGISAAKPAGSPIAKPEDLNGKVVGVQIGTSGQAFIRENVPGIKAMKTYDTILLALKDLANGRVDAVVNPLPSIRYNMKGLGGMEVTKVWSGTVIAVGIRKEDKALATEINKHLAALKKEGLLEKLDKKWFE